MKTTLKKFVSARITTFRFKFKQTSLIVPISLLTFIISLPSGKVRAPSVQSIVASQQYRHAIVDEPYPIAFFDSR